MPVAYARLAGPAELQMTWLHEAFHAFQASRGWRLTAPDAPWVVVPPGAVALARAEMEVLCSGLDVSADRTAGAPALARRFLGARTARRNELPDLDDLARFERAVEIHEGVANWVMGQLDNEVRHGIWAQLMRTVLGRPAGPVFSLFRGPSLRGQPSAVFSKG